MPAKKPSPPWPNDNTLRLPRIHALIADKTISEWAWQAWTPATIRVAFWTMRGVPSSWAYWVAYLDLVDRGVSHVEAIEQVAQAKVLRKAVAEGLVNPLWELDVDIGDDRGRPSERNPWRDRVWDKAVRRWARVESKRLYDSPNKNLWYKPWCAAFDSMSVMPEFPLDAMPWLRCLAMPEPTTHANDEFVLLQILSKERFDEEGRPRRLYSADRRRQSWRRADAAWRRNRFFGLKEGENQWLLPWGIYKALLSGRSHPIGEATLSSARISRESFVEDNERQGHQPVWRGGVRR